VNTLHEYVTLVGLILTVVGAAIGAFSWDQYLVRGTSNKSTKMLLSLFPWALLSIVIGIITMFIGGSLNPNN